jgi:hypothetical protein
MATKVALILHGFESECSDYINIFSLQKSNLNRVFLYLWILTTFGFISPQFFSLSLTLNSTKKLKLVRQKNYWFRMQKKFSMLPYLWHITHSLPSNKNYLRFF